MNKIITSNLKIFFVFTLLFSTLVSPINVLAYSDTTTEIYVHEGKVTRGEADHGAHLYVYSEFNRRYYKVSMEVDLPSSRYIDLADDTRAAYISLGVSGGKDKAVDFGLRNIGNGWHPYRYDISRKSFFAYEHIKYSGTVDMSLETSIRNGQTVITLTVDNDTYEYIPRRSTFDEYKGLVDNEFYRFVSLVNKGSYDDHDDGSELRDVELSDIKIYKVYTDDGYPDTTRNPRKYAWGINASTVDRAWEVYPDYIDVDPGTYTETVDIRHNH